MVLVTHFYESTMCEHIAYSYSLRVVVYKAYDNLELHSAQEILLHGTEFSESPFCFFLVSISSVLNEGPRIVQRRPGT